MNSFAAGVGAVIVDEELGTKSQIPPALAAWSFSFALQTCPKASEDTTCFSSVEFQFRARV